MLNQSTGIPDSAGGKTSGMADAKFDRNTLFSSQNDVG